MLIFFYEVCITTFFSKPLLIYTMHHTINHILNYVYKKYINYLKGIKYIPIFFRTWFLR